jgi:hypothetical protein
MKTEPLRKPVNSECGASTLGTVTGGERGFPQLPSFHTKSQVLEIHKHERHSKLPHNKEFHKVEVLARIFLV